MGGISAPRQFFADSFIEIVGFKTGIVLDELKLFDLLKEHGAIHRRLRPDGEKWARLESVEVEEVVAFLLYKLGNIPAPSAMSSHIAMHHKYRSDPKFYECFTAVSEMYITFTRQALEAARIEPPASGMLDPTSFMNSAFEAYGNTGAEMAMEMIKGTNGDMHRSPWGSMRSVDWKDAIELKSLFEDEGLDTSYGSFFDQRFIDYLHQNFGEIGDINWRKFEGLTAEYFDREGFQVEVGPGRNDDGIDLRIRPKNPNDETAALIIVQCKRQKARIDKALVKSVYADVLHEKAKSGLIVTTSSLSPGAAELRTARGYPIEAADRPMLKQWIEKMRTS